MVREVSATELVRNFAEYLNRVAYRGERFVIVRSNKVVGELKPTTSGVRLGALPSLLASLPRLGREEAAQLEDELATARSDLDAIGGRDPWA